MEKMKSDPVAIFAIRLPFLRQNVLSRPDFMPFLNRTIFLDDSPESKATNTCLVFAFHNGIINTLNKIHTKKLGAPANTQMNLRLILDKVNGDNLRKFSEKIDAQIAGKYRLVRSDISAQKVNGSGSLGNINLP